MQTYLVHADLTHLKESVYNAYQQRVILQKFDEPTSEAPFNYRFEQMFIAFLI